MKINFLVNPVSGGWEPSDTRLGGTEESVVRWSEELEKRGHKVWTYFNGHNFDNYKDYAPADVCINIKYPEFATQEPTFYLTNETDATKHDLSKFEGVIWPSKWAVDNIPVNNKTFILPHGYDPEKIYPSRKIRKQCFYASSPDRGLETLLKVWPEVYKKYPDSTLILTYGANIGQIDGVINLGNVDEETMNEIYRTSEFWCHPCNGGELYCMTGIKAQASGCVPVIIPRMALSETVLGGFWAEDESAYSEALDTALSSPAEEIEQLREQLTSHHYPTWGDSVDKLEEIIGLVMKK